MNDHPDKKHEKKRDHGDMEPETVEGDDSLELEDADEAILSSLQDIAENIDAYGDENLDDDDLDEEGEDDDEIVVPLVEEAGDEGEETLGDDAPLRSSKVHVIHEHEISTRDKEIEYLRDELRRITTESSKAGNQFQRLKADFDNFKRRQQREVQEKLEKREKGLILDMLPVLDNLERGLEAFAEGEQNSEHRKGFELTRKIFLKSLRTFEVLPIEAKGQHFDPELHEAIATAETGEVAPNTVLEEHERGYTYKGKVLRPSRVTVAKALVGEKPAPAEERPEVQTVETTSTEPENDVTVGASAETLGEDAPTPEATAESTEEAPPAQEPAEDAETAPAEDEAPEATDTDDETTEPEPSDEETESPKD